MAVLDASMIVLQLFSKGFEGKKGPFGKTPEKLVQDLRESRIDPMAPVMVSPSPWQRITALINELITWQDTCGLIKEVE